MKKFILLVITTIIALLLIEFGSWSTIQVYQLIKYPKADTDIRGEIVALTDIKSEIDTLGGMREFSPEDVYEYRAFYGWVKKDIYSKNINVINNQRKTKKNPNWDLKSRIWFFGGSSIWGDYVSDENTVPSLSSNLDHNFQPVNFAESGYNAGQSLNRLIENIDKINEGDHVVFFDGVNDAFGNCLSLNGPNGHHEVKKMRRLISYDENFLKSLFIRGFKKIQESHTVTLLNAIGKRIGLQDFKKINEFNYYSCNQTEYAFKVAESLVRHWKIAEIITKNRKANFTCILQPNPYTANFKVNQSTIAFWKQATLDVYPKITELAKSLDCFNDLTNLFDEDYYFDGCCHVNAKGNKIISKKIINILFKS